MRTIGKARRLQEWSSHMPGEYGEMVDAACRDAVRQGTHTDGGQHHVMRLQKKHAADGIGESLTGRNWLEGKSCTHPGGRLADDESEKTSWEVLEERGGALGGRLPPPGHLARPQIHQSHGALTGLPRLQASAPVRPGHPPQGSLQAASAVAYPSLCGQQSGSRPSPHPPQTPCKSTQLSPHVASFGNLFAENSRCSCLPCRAACDDQRL